MDNTNFIDSEGHIIKTSSMRDQHQLIKITEKTPMLQNIGKIVCGDTNSNILTFEIDRYYDGVDLYTKNIKFIVKNELGIFTEDAVNLQYNSEFLRFSWILSESVTYKSGAITAAIIFIGTDSEQNYALKTMPFTINIDNSLSFVDTRPPYKNWFADIEAKLYQLGENNGSNIDNSASLHTHNNKNVLDKLDISDKGTLLFNGNEINSGNITSAGKSAYEIALDNGFEGTELEWLETLKGEDGIDGINGESAYQIAVKNGFIGTEKEWLDSLKGETNGGEDTIKITFATTKPTSVPEGEIIMVYEE